MAYDPATQWLLDTMHNPRIYLRHRIEAAKALLELGHTERAPIHIDLKVIVPPLPTDAPQIEDQSRPRLCKMH